VLETRAGVLSATDIQFLTFRSGYENMGPLSCVTATTVDECLNTQTNGVQTLADVGKFYYNGAHMQRHAHDNGLGSMGNAALTAQVQSQIGNFGFVFTAPQPAGGVVASAANYASFLRKIIAGNLQISSQLGSQAVCTNPNTCASAVYTPVPPTESWHYSLGHWVEDDPVAGDGSFSSAGAFGFYPWIDASKRYYGIVARHSASIASGAGFDSAACGRVIRKAWMTGVAQ
jgi:hypothetical protein